MLPMGPPGQKFDMGFWGRIQGAGAADDDELDGPAPAPAAYDTSDTHWYLKARNKYTCMGLGMLQEAGCSVAVYRLHVIHSIHNICFACTGAGACSKSHHAA